MGATSWLRWLATASQSIDGQTASAIHRSDCDSPPVEGGSPGTQARFWMVPTIRSTTTAAYPASHQRNCVLEGSKGSMTSGNASRASRQAVLETAYSQYGSLPVVAPAYQDCTSGLVLDRTKKGRPT